MLLRRPDHKNVWKFKGEFFKLVSIEHHLDIVVNSGLPESDYNQSLAEFDNDMCGCLSAKENGIPILIETFSGKRNYYYYYVRPEIELSFLLEAAKSEYNVNLTGWDKIDQDWKFLDAYPMEIFRK